MSDQPAMIEVVTSPELAEPLASSPEEFVSPPEPLVNPREVDARELTPAQEQPAKGAETFTILAGVPYRFTGWNMCCTRYAAELWQDEYDQTFVTFTHADDCDVWLYL